MHHILMLLPLLALALFIFLPWQLALILYIPIAIGSLVILRKIIQAQRLLAVTGESAMVGNRAVVVGGEGKEVEVHYRGEIWHAVSPQSLHRDQEVVIEDVKGLTLQVMPLPQPMREPEPRA